MMQILLLIVRTYTVVSLSIRGEGSRIPARKPRNMMSNEDPFVNTNRGKYGPPIRRRVADKAQPISTPVL